MERTSVGVALFGLGMWGKLFWAGPLLQMAEAREIDLSLVDRVKSAPDWIRHSVSTVDVRAEDLVMEGADHKLRDMPAGSTFQILPEHVRYVDAAQRERYADIQLAVVVTGAWDHLATIQTILKDCRNLKYLICEKPCGNSLLEFSEIVSSCEAAGVQLVVSDHYLLGEGIRLALQEGSLHDALGRSKLVSAYLLEEASSGPPDQDVNLDMLIHLLNLVHTLIPGSHFKASRACMGRGLRAPHAAITYCLAEGILASGATEIPCQLEVAKQLENRKEIVFNTEPKPECFELGNVSPWHHGEWVYTELVRAVLKGCDDERELRLLGGIPGPSMLAVWEEMENIRARATIIHRHASGTRPPCRRRVDAPHSVTDPATLALFGDATAAVEMAGERLLHVTRRSDVVVDRGIDDYITPLDLETETFLSEKLARHDAQGRSILFIGEEEECSDENHVQIESDHLYWIVDPLDGTANAVWGRPEVAVSVALYCGHKPQFGVIRLPGRGLTVRRRGNAAIEVNNLSWEPLKLSATHLEDAVIGLPGDLRRLRITSAERLIERILHEAAAIRVTGALAYDLAALALGEIDARISTSAKLVDVAAGVHLVEGVGGIATDWEGRPWKLGASFLAARTKELHEQLVELCRGMS